VEAEWDPHDPQGEMAFISEVRKGGFPTVAIAQAWLHHDDCAAVLESHAARGFVRGVRHKPKPGQMDDARWRAGYARLAPLGLHFELQAPWGQLAEAERLARDFPQTLIVLNHTGLPYDDQLPGWRVALSKFSTCPNTAVKISGLGNVSRKRDAILTAIEFFGPQRAMFASNFPVDRLRGSFDAIYSEFDRCTQNLSDPERRGLFYDNAVRLYRMDLQ
jgi:predicted TIM-barrel fold metal-dependent hydrolase